MCRMDKEQAVFRRLTLSDFFPLLLIFELIQQAAMVNFMSDSNIFKILKISF